jgi:beta-lactamase regulating signal transducer with metallopeptidase domain
MTTDLLLLMFLKAQAAASGAILLVLALRLPARRLIGAELAYRLWILAPAAALVSLFPTLPQFLEDVNRMRSGVETAVFNLRASPLHYANAPILAVVWAIGFVAMGLGFVAIQARFNRQARAGEAGPAATGFWPRMIVPADYADRFTAEERALIRSHERQHMERRDPTTNLLIAFCQAVGWFNPLVHLAASLARMDQELSIDAKVIAQHPRGRRQYAETLLKAQAHGLNSPLACALALGGKHPLEVRLAMLGVRPISVRRDLLGVTGIGLIAVCLAVALWTLAPI